MLVAFTRHVDAWKDGVNAGEWGLALVYRDGTADIVVDEGDARLDAGSAIMPAAVSATTVAWNTSIWDSPTHASTHAVTMFWDRETHQLAEGAATVEDGARIADIEASPWDFTLVGEVALWTQPVHWDDASLVLVAATPDGRTWLPLGTTDAVRVRLDHCASTGDHSVLSVVGRIDMPDGARRIAVERVTLGADGIATIAPGETIVPAEGGDAFYAMPYFERCGDTILTKYARTGGDENSTHFFGTATSLAPEPHPVYEDDAPLSATRSMEFTPSWILLALDDDSGITIHLINRSTGVRHDVDGGFLCGEIVVNGPYAMWHQERDPFAESGTVPPMLVCGTYVGEFAS